MKPETDSDGTVAFIRLLGLTKIISKDLEVFNLRLLLHAHFLILVISAEHDLISVAGMITYVSSAYFNKELPGVTDYKSDAVTTYKTGPQRAVETCWGSQGCWSSSGADWGKIYAPEH